MGKKIQNKVALVIKAGGGSISHKDIEVSVSSKKTFETIAVFYRDAEGITEDIRFSPCQQGSSSIGRIP